MKIAVNAISAKMGGALTYLQNALPELRDRLGAHSRLLVWRPAANGEQDGWPDGIEYRENQRATGGGPASQPSAFRRLWFDQIEVPRALRAESFDALFSSANFGPIVPTCRHVLLVRNAAYFDETFLARMKTRRVRMYYAAQRLLTIASIRRADVVLFPSRSMMDLVAASIGGMPKNWVVAPYGARHDLFRRSMPESGLHRKSNVDLLNVSLYCDQKNLGTLMRAVEILSASAARKVRLKLTAGFRRPWNDIDGFLPNLVTEREQFFRLEAGGLAADVDWKQYGSLPALYHSADIFVFPSYSESFGHPLVEAMASGLPVVAADVPINREMCGDAAIYFSPFDPDACAAAVERVITDPVLADELRAAGLARATEFNWSRHVDALIHSLRAA